MAAHIDLSWLAQLLTKAPTADTQANTPDLDPGSVGKFLNPNPTSQADIDTSQPYQPPSNVQRLVWGPQSAEIDRLNNQFSAYPRQQNLQNLTDLAIRAANIQKMNPALRPPGLTPEQAAVSGYGDKSNPVATGAMNTSVLEQQGGLPKILAETALTQGQTGLQKAGGELARTPTTELALNQEAMNRLAQVTQVDPLQINLAHADYVAANKREPSENELKDYITQNQLRYQKEVTPPTIGGEAAQARTGESLALQRENMLPFELQAQGNQLVGQAAESQYAPVQEPFGNRIDYKNGTMTPIVRNPMGGWQPGLQMQLIKELTGNNTQDLTLPSGKTIKVPVNAASHQPFSVLGPQYTPAGGLSARATLGGGSNNVTDNQVHNITGSMAPPVPTASSDTTLTPGLNPRINAPEEQYSPEDYLNPKTLNEEPNSHQSISNQIGKITAKYQGQGRLFKMSDEDIAKLKELTNALGKAQ